MAFGNDELEELFAQDAEKKEATLEQLGEIAKLGQRQLELQELVAEAERALSALKDDLKEVQEVDIPNMMAECGLSEVKLENGARLTIKKDIFCSIRKDHMAAGLKFFEDMGLGNLIKDDITVKFGKGDADKAKAVMDFCKENQYAAQEKKSIHPQTLKAEIKRQLESGTNFPDDVFSITPFAKSIIKI